MWDSLSRPQLVGRIVALRGALDQLRAQSDRDRAGLYPCTGSMKRTLLELEDELWQRDKRAGLIPAQRPDYEPGLPLEVALAAVSATAARQERSE